MSSCDWLQVTCELSGAEMLSVVSGALVVGAGVEGGRRRRYPRKGSVKFAIYSPVTRGAAPRVFTQPLAELLLNINVMISKDEIAD